MVNPTKSRDQSTKWRLLRYIYTTAGFHLCHPNDPIYLVEMLKGSEQRVESGKALCPKLCETRETAGKSQSMSLQCGQAVFGPSIDDTWHCMWVGHAQCVGGTWDNIFICPAPVLIRKRRSVHSSPAPIKTSSDFNPMSAYIAYS